MRITLKELMDLLEVGEVLGPYQTRPWSCYDSEKEQTCSAEVRMGPDGDEVEVEIQMMYDVPPEGKPPVEHIYWMKAAPVQGQWAVTGLRVRDESYGQDIYNWEEKACKFFAAVVRNLQMDEIPDIDELLENEFHNRERFSGKAEGGGGKSPRIRADQFLNMKGRGF